MSDKKYKCRIDGCNKSFGKWQGISAHVSRTHKIPMSQYYVDYYLDGKWPKCKCGCGEKLPYQRGLYKSKIVRDGYRFFEYIVGHHNRVNPYQKGRTYVEIMGEKRAKERYDKIFTEERAKKISKSLKGKPKSSEHIKKITKDRKKYWSNPKHQEEQRDRRVKWIAENGFAHSSGLEDLFKEILDSLDIDYTYQFPLKGKIYDFRINNTNVLIEVDGDFFHANPDVFDSDDLNEMQLKNIENDKIKNKLAKKQGYKLLRFWENDIKSDIETILDNIYEYTNLEVAS